MTDAQASEAAGPGAGDKLARRMYLLQYGREPSPKWISVRGGGEEILWLPIIGAVVETDAGWVLLETGMSRRFLEDPEALAEIYPSVEQPEMWAPAPLQGALKRVGLAPEDLLLAAVSHLHVDHAGGVARLAEAGVTVAVQRAEMSFARDRATRAEAYYHEDFADVGADWHELEGDAEIAPGVSALFTPGHTPGHMSYRVRLPQTGTWILAVDAACTSQNLVDQVPGGWTADPGDVPRIEDSLARLLTEARRDDARLLPGHDGFCWAAARHPDGGWR